MIKELHIAAQYLAAAGISFVEKQADDSHTNLGWNPESRILTTHDLDSKNIMLGLDYSDFSLVFLKGEVEFSKEELKGKSHAQILSWITTQLAALGINRDYIYDFHYDTGYEELTDNYIFSSYNSDEAGKIADLVSKGHQTFERFLETNNLESPIRVWPHHFDLGIYTGLAENLFMGAGLAIPDSVCTDFYFYASGWLEGKTMGDTGFSSLSNGEWGKGGYNGAVLDSKSVTTDEALKFFNEAKQNFL